MRLLFFLTLFFICQVPTYASESIRINEFLPNPVGDDADGEWIEMYNAGTTTVDLEGWKIRDVYGVTTEFTFHSAAMITVIQPDEYVVLPRSLTHITLNNDTEQLVLIDASGLQSTTDVYTTIEEGKSWSFIQGLWVMSTPTPGLINEIPATPTPMPTTTPSPSLLPTPLPTQTATPSSSIPNIHDGIAITEISACTGTTEWVELYNLHAEDERLTGWSLRDSSGQKKVLDDIVLPSTGYGVKEWSSFMLNNTGDDVVLVNAQGEIVDSMSYEDCEKQTSWARDAVGWHMTTHMTKREKNGEVEPMESPTPSQDMRQVIPSVQASTPSGILIQQKAKKEPLAFSTPQLVRKPKEILQIVSRHILRRQKQISSPIYWHIVCFFFGGGFFLEAAGFLFFRWYNELHAKNLVIY